MPSTAARCVAFFLVALAPSGCQNDGRPEPPRAVPAGGKVTYKGKPLPNATVTFHKVGGTESSSGTTDAKGAFRLGTYDTADGAPPGVYAVTVAVIEPDGEEGPSAAPAASPVPAAYADPESSKLRFTVTEAGPNDFTVVLK